MISSPRFVFYPKGVDAGSHGYCGLYLKCSDENVFLKFQLHVGKQAKLFEHFYATRGEVYGKTRFCPLEPQVENRGDPELSLLNISVEILEVSHRQRDTENVLLFHRDDTYAKEEFRVLTLPPRKQVRVGQANKPAARGKYLQCVSISHFPRAVPDHVL